MKKGLAHLNRFSAALLYEALGKKGAYHTTFNHLLRV